MFYRNGLLQKRLLDYTITGNTVTFVPLATPQSGDILIASYRTKLNVSFKYEGGG